MYQIISDVNDRDSKLMAAQTEIEKICMIETVIFCIDPKSVGPLNFLGRKEFDLV